MSTIECSIIIPVLNQLSYTKDCLDSLKSCTDGRTLEVIIVDNGSTDETAAYLAGLGNLPFAHRIISFPENRGYSGANNAAAELARGHWLVFLNNDTVLRPGWLHELLQVGSLPGVGIAGSKLLYPGFDRINHAGYVFNALLRRFYLIYELFPSDHPAVNQQRDFQALLGACLLLSRDTFYRAGTFSEFGLEDIDLCLKVRKLGLRATYAPKSVLYHYGSVTLHGTPPALLPPVSTDQFSERWPWQQLAWDDLTFYTADKLVPDFSEPQRVAVRTQGGELIVTDSSTRLPLWKDVETQVQEEFVLVKSAVAERRFAEAFKRVESICKFCPWHHEAFFTWSMLFVALGEVAGARRVLEMLLTQQIVSEDNRRAATARLAQLSARETG